jgi:glutamyl-tRNA synthetase
MAFYNDVIAQADDVAKHITPAVLPALDALAAKLDAVAEWSVVNVSAAFKEVLTEQGLKMPQLAMPVRVLVMGTPQTPSVDAVLWLCGKEKVLSRLTKR